MRNTVLTICLFALTAFLPAGSAVAAVAGNNPNDPQEADVGTIYRQGQGVDEQNVRDMEAQSAIYETLLTETNIDPDGIHVQVDDGRVTLTGEVSDESAREEVAAVAKKTKHVASVTNKLAISGNS